MIAALAKHMPQSAFVFVWDGRGETWRHAITNGTYKGHRQGPPNEDMAPAFPQIPILRKALCEAGFREFECDCLEADDLIGILAEVAIKKKLFENVVIYSTDKDFYQLVTDKVGVLRGYDKDAPEHVMFEDEVGEEIGIRPQEWVKVKALTGDPTDNIPKIATGLGPKTAIKMIQAGLDPSFEDFKKHQWIVKQNFQTLGNMWGKVRRNYSLSQIVCSVDDVRLPEDVRKNLSWVAADLTRESFLREKRKLTDESFATFTEWLAEYELNELIGMRQELWRLP
jgi:5'-3' exonuclease